MLEDLVSYKKLLESFSVLIYLALLVGRFRMHTESTAFFVSRSCSLGISKVGAYHIAFWERT